MQPDLYLTDAKMSSYIAEAGSDFAENWEKRT